MPSQICFWRPGRSLIPVLISLLLIVSCQSPPQRPVDAPSEAAGGRQSQPTLAVPGPTNAKATGPAEPAMPASPTHALQPTLEPPVTPSIAAPAQASAAGPQTSASSTVATATEAGPLVSRSAVSPLPAQDINSRELAALISDGAYPEAIAAWESHEPEPVDADLMLSVARVYVEEKRPQKALELAERLLQDASGAPLQAKAAALKASLLLSMGNRREAIAALERYLELDQAAAPYVELAIANELEALGEDERAAETLAAIETDDIPSALRAEVLEELATMQTKTGEFEQAVQSYGEILSFAQNDRYRALVEYDLAKSLLRLEREDQAVERLEGILRDYPRSDGAYLALSALDGMGRADVAPIERARLLLSARQYQNALDLMENYVLEHADGPLAEALYLKALAHTELGQFTEAFETFDAIMRRYPDVELIGEVWMAKAEAAERYGSDPSSIYHEFWRLHGDHARAPEALWLGAQALESEDKWPRAEALYHLVAEHHPDSDWAAESLFREGLMAYAQGNWQQAIVVWEDSLDREQTTGKRARLKTWIGIAARASGDQSAAQSAWDEAMALAPRSYYGHRARDLALGREPVLPADAAEGAVLEAAAPVAWDQLENWVGTWYTGTTETAPDLAEHPLARRGSALLDLGWRAQAMTVYRQLRDAFEDDPMVTLRLARLFDESGLDALAISSASRVIWAARQAAASAPPDALLRLAYPPTYSHLIAAEADRYALDPLLMLALIRQESRFDPVAVSYAGAQGLMQVMPDTGTWIAERIGIENHATSHLSRPIISIHYGSWFMKTLLDLYDRDWIAALVAYNAGPGNLRRWTDDQPIVDHDLFYETLPVQQAQDYVRLIYEQYRTYQSLYTASE